MLEEAIASFLHQDYCGPKELIVLNDCADQQLVLAHPEITIVNVRKRFHTVGEKRNCCAALTSHDILFVWDDDDIYLPHRISLSLRKMTESSRFFKPSRALTMNNGVLGGPCSNLFHSGACFRRSLFDQVKGYPHINSGQDVEFEKAVERVLGPAKNYDALPDSDLYYIYRWGGTGSYHLSAFGRDKMGQPTGMERVRASIERQVKMKQLPSGEIRLHPHWHQDYAAMVGTYISRGNP